MKNDFDIDKLSYEDYSDAEVKSYEDLGEKLNVNLEDKKKEGRRKLFLENLREIEDSFYDTLEIGEVLKYRCDGVMGGIQYWAATTGSADYFMTPFAFMDIGSKMKIYITDRKIVVFEVGSFLKIMKKYVMNINDIKRFKCNRKKFKVTFFCNKDKNNSIRECSNPLLYYFLQGRFGFYITTKNKEEVIEYLNNTFNSLS